MITIIIAVSHCCLQPAIITEPTQAAPSDTAVDRSGANVTFEQFRQSEWCKVPPRPYSHSTNLSTNIDHNTS